MLLFSAFILALAITIALIPPLMRVAEQLSVIDTPNERKVHSDAIPRIGGIAMVIGACFPILLWLPHTRMVMALLVAQLILLVFGAWDDSRDLDYRLKFLGQFAAVFVVVFVGDVKVAIGVVACEGSGECCRRRFLCDPDPDIEQTKTYNVRD